MTPQEAAFQIIIDFRIQLEQLSTERQLLAAEVVSLRAQVIELEAKLTRRRVKVSQGNGDS